MKVKTIEEVCCCNDPDLSESGWDVWPGGEEDQYTCENCGKMIQHVKLLPITLNTEEGYEKFGYTQKEADDLAKDCEGFGTLETGYDFWSWKSKT